MYSISQPIIRGILLKKKMKTSFLLYYHRFVQRLLVPVPAQGAVPCKHIPRTRYVVSGTYYTYQVYCIWYISSTSYRLASCILYIVPRISDLDLQSGIWDDNCGTLTIFISDQAITVEHTESIRILQALGSGTDNEEIIYENNTWKIGRAFLFLI